MTLAIVNEVSIVMLFVVWKKWFEINNIITQAQVIESMGFTNNSVTLKWVLVRSFILRSVIVVTTIDVMNHINIKPFKP